MVSGWAAETGSASTPQGAPHIWQLALTRLSVRLNPQVFQTWFHPVRALDLVNQELTLAVPSAWHMDWLKDHYQHILKKKLQTILPGATVKVRQNLALVLGLEGKFAEAEAIQREDLPPQMADNNLAYLKAATAVPVVK